ncbi:hypothetical protein K432DRAFT_330320, partial [Lepidopterella palustris CBS 459.81]
MNALLTRSPLQTLSMTSTQRPTRRRSARNAFEEDEVPVVKRAKTEVNGTNRAATRTNGGTKKATKAAYDENDDGFQFSRTKSKRTQAKATSAAEQAPVESKPATSRRRKNSITAPEPVDAEVPVKRRRSARLSGDKEQITLAPDTKPAPRRSKKAAVAEAKGSSGQDDTVDFVGGAKSGINELHVEKKRNGEATKIALPFADTPIIKRNKEMRKGSGQSHRRSSTGMRGRRASSLIDSGQSNAVPHAEVETKDFYKHIEQSLPEPRRMKQLLTWCGTRALPEKPLGNVKDTNAIMA